MPRVRVVIPTFNRAAVVSGAITTVLAQTFQDYELVVADDGSTDETLAAVRARSRLDPRLRVIACTHGGVARTRNVAVTEPGAHQYVAFLDSDDRWEPDHLESAVALLDGEPGVALVFGSFETQDRTGTWSAHERDELERRIRHALSLSARRHGRDGHILDPARTRSAFLQGDLHPKTSTAVVRVSAVAPGPWFDESMTIMEDSDFYLRLVASGQPWAFIDRKQCTVQFLGDNLTRAHDFALPATLDRLRSDLRFERRRLALCATRSERLRVRKAVAEKAYLVGQSHAEQGAWAAARRAYWESLLARPGSLALTSLAGSCLPRPVRMAVRSLRSRPRTSA